jgi:hypothetical protein
MPIPAWWWMRPCDCTLGNRAIMLIAMAVSLAGEGGQALLGEALRQVPALCQSPDIAAIDQALAEGGYDFAW